MEQALPDLRAYQVKVAAELAQLDDELAELKSRRDKKVDELRALETLLAIHDPTFQPTLDAHAAPQPGKRNKVSLPDKAFEVLQELGAPTYYVDLHDAMVERGIDIPGKNPPANLLTQIGQDPRFMRVERGTYALVEWASPDDLDLVIDD